MYKNFSYVFGLGALLMLVACDDGKQTESKQETVTEESQESTAVDRKTQPIREDSSEKQTNNQDVAEEPQEEGIYADINKPIELEAPSLGPAGTRVDAAVDAITDAKVAENDSMPPVDNVPAAQKEASSAKTEPVTDVTADSTSESNSTAESQAEPQMESSKTADNPAADTSSISENTEQLGTTDMEGTPLNDAKSENTEISSEIPEVSMVSDVPVISEESVEEQSSEIEHIPESAPNVE